MIQAAIQKAEPAHLLKALEWVKTEEELLLWAGRGLAFPVRPNDWLASLVKPDLIPFAFLTQDQTLIGYLELSRIDLVHKSGYFSRVILNPDFRGLGYASAMLKQLIAYAERITGLDLIFLNVFEENRRAVDLYMREGFTKLENSQFCVMGKSFDKTGFRMVRQKKG